jgi:tRNA dimethylallyltransferase
MKRVALLLMGPTGAGKSDLALELADRLPLDIVSVDSALVYRGMDIGTAKPTPEEQARVPHHLIDILDPAQSYSAGEFLRDAHMAMQAIWARGRQPLLVGGTMMYFHALTHGIAELPQGDAQLRADIEREAATRGWGALHAELARVDAAAARRIHVNDPQRIQRALEVFRLTGTPITDLQQARRSPLTAIDTLEIALAPTERSRLHQNIERRFERMMQRGFLAEVRALRERGDLTLIHPSIRCVGYRQLWQHLEGEFGLEEGIRRGITATRQLAKRQWTWLRRRTQATWLDPVHPNAAQSVIFALDSRMKNSAKSC